MLPVLTLDTVFDLFAKDTAKVKYFFKSDKKLVLDKKVFVTSAPNT